MPRICRLVLRIRGFLFKMAKKNPLAKAKGRQLVSVNTIMNKFLKIRDCLSATPTVKILKLNSCHTIRQPANSFRCLIRAGKTVIKSLTFCLSDSIT